MKIDLNFNGGFVLDVDDDMDEDAQYELIQRIEKETNAAIGKVAYKFGISATTVELQEE